MKTDLTMQEVRELNKKCLIDWKDKSPRSMGSNMSYQMRENEHGKALYILRIDPVQSWCFCGKIKDIE